MLSNAERARLVVVLVGARNPQNIGAAARAMQDFGFADLRIVNPYAAPFEAAQIDARLNEAELPTPKSAVGAANVMLNARRFDGLAEAIADCNLVVGTTAIGGREMQRAVVAMRQAAPHVLAVLHGEVSAQNSHEGESEQRAALLFGSEKTGLTNEQMSHCSLLTTIPMFAPKGRHLSMNLGQSVAVCLYELVREGFEGARELPVMQDLAPTAEDRERLTELLQRAMQATDYARRFPANSREHVVRRLAQQLGKNKSEASTWMGFLRHVVRSKE